MLGKTLAFFIAEPKGFVLVQIRGDILETLIMPFAVA